MEAKDRGMQQARILLIGANGYVGSRIAYECAARGWPVIGCDHTSPPSSTAFADFFAGPYAELPDHVLHAVDCVLWFSGHSSVKKAAEDPAGSIHNNVIDLAVLLQRLAERHKPLIYASSASVLSSNTGRYSAVADEGRVNSYDAGKLAFDLIAPFLGGRALGLRMATVSGWSPNQRWDLVFNAMNRSAATEGVVRVQNAASFRSLLFIEDLCAYLFNTIPTLCLDDWTGARRAALGSWAGTIGGLGSEIASFWNVPVEWGPDGATYSFVLDDTELCAGVTGNVRKSLVERCQLFRAQNGW